MNSKEERWYEKMWIKLRGNINGSLHLRTAHFDYEPAAISSFRRQFQGVDTKMCCFHVKQALARKLSSKGFGLNKLYRENKTVQKIVRMIGALQFVPQTEIENCIQLIISMIGKLSIIIIIGQ